MAVVPDRRTNSPLRVLIVDDEPDTVLSTSILLQIYGYEVFSASNGHHALELVGTEQPHVVIFDLAMPGFSGVALAKCIRDGETIRRPFLIAHTGMRNSRTLDEVHSVGIDLLMFKPANFDSLRSVIERFALLIHENSGDSAESAASTDEVQAFSTITGQSGLTVQLSASMPSGVWNCCLCKRPWEIQCVAVEIRDDRRQLGIMCPACLRVRPGYLADQMKEEAQALADGLNKLRGYFVRQSRSQTIPTDPLAIRAAMAHLRARSERLRQQCDEIRQNSLRLHAVTDQTRREIEQVQERRQQLILESRRLRSQHPALTQSTFDFELAEAVEQFETTVVLADHFKKLNHWPVSLKDVIQKERSYISQRFLGINSADLRLLVDDRYDEFFRTLA